jgi:hypothetical protein
VYRSLDYLLMAGTQSSAIKLREDEWRRQYFNAYYKSSPKAIDSTGNDDAESKIVAAVQAPKWKEILIDVFSASEMNRFIYIRPSTTLFPSDPVASSSPLPATAITTTTTSSSVPVTATPVALAPPTSLLSRSHSSSSSSTASTQHQQRYGVPTVLRFAHERVAGAPAIVSQSDFEMRWNNLSEGLFAGFDWSNVFAAGKRAFASVVYFFISMLWSCC